MKLLPLAATLLLTLTQPALGQNPSKWVSAWGGLYLDPGTVQDDQDGTEWDFGSSVAAGTAFQIRLGPSLIAGLELGYSPIRHEVRRLAEREEGELLADGRAHLLTTMLTGRLGAGGGGDFFTYLGGGIGAVTYGIPSLERWDPDFSFRVGPGLEYRQSAALSLFAEWNRWWVLHQTEGVDDNTIRQSNLQIGVRYGF